MSVVCSVGSSLCDELITHPEESYQVFVCLIVCVCVWLRNLNSQTAQSLAGLLCHWRKKKNTWNKNDVPRVYSVADILWLQYMLHVMVYLVINILYFYICTFCSKYAVPNSFISCFPCMLLLRYFQSDFEVVPVAPVSTGITFILTLDMECICFLWSLCFKVFLTSFWSRFIIIIITMIKLIQYLMS